MATVYIAEYGKLARIEGFGNGQIPDEASLIAEQTVAIGGASAQSSAFNAGTQLIRVHTDAICSIAISANPTATATKKRMAANQTEYYGVQSGWKLAAITNV